MQYLVIRHCTMPFGQQLRYTNMVSVLPCRRTIAILIKSRVGNENLSRIGRPFQKET